MSYHVTILRTERGRQQPVTRDEVEDALRARRDLESRETPEGVLEISIRALGGSSPMLVWQDGEIWTKNPDDSTLGLMIELAGALKARVRGDELETYRSVDESYEHPDDTAAIREARGKTEARWRRSRWLTRVTPFAVLFLLALLVRFCSHP